MTAQRRVVLICNVEGCLNSYQGELGWQHPSINLARNQSIEAGWHNRVGAYRQTWDYCPDHYEEYLYGLQEARRAAP